MKLTLTLRELLNNYDWGKTCKVLGLDHSCINEGRGAGDEEQEITEEQAREIGILPLSNRRDKTLACETCGKSISNYCPKCERMWAS